MSGTFNAGAAKCKKSKFCNDISEFPDLEEEAGNKYLIIDVR